MITDTKAAAKPLPLTIAPGAKKYAGGGPAFTLTGLSITVTVPSQGGPVEVEKFVGKVGQCPYNPCIPGLKGRIILYREVPWKDAFAHLLNSIGVDSEAWDTAREMGAQGMVIYCKDTGQMLLVGAATFANPKLAPKIDMGERPQYRIRTGDFKVIEGCGPVSIGFTTAVHKLAPKVLPETAAEFEQVKSAIVSKFVESPQLTMSI